MENLKILAIPGSIFVLAGIGLLKIYHEVSKAGTQTDLEFFQIACGLETIGIILFFFACYLLTRDPLGHIEE